MSDKLLKIMDIDNGFCRVVYVAKNNNGQKVFYCLQDEGDENIQFYRCTDYSYIEPDYTVKCKDWTIMEIPTGDSCIEKIVRDFINKKLKDSGE